MSTMSELGWKVEMETPDWAIIRRLNRSLADGTVDGADWGLFPDVSRGYVNPRLSVSVRFSEVEADIDEVGRVPVTVAWTGVHGHNALDIERMMAMLTMAQNFILMRQHLTFDEWQAVHTKETS